MRGNPYFAGGGIVVTRSIPACAGEPAVVARYNLRKAVYPRVCGGTLAAMYQRVASSGLSPRVRGNLRRPQRRHQPVRSIPACAGEPSASGVRCARHWVYPRVCGGTGNPNASSSARMGLSPRVRGNPPPPSVPPPHSRSIPACAGEPRPQSRRGESGKVYPRVCGGTPAGGAGAGRRPGCHRWSIPACAGEPSGHARRRRIPPVYPRVCGGTRRAACRPATAGGLSPRVRGKVAFRFRWFG